MKTQFLFAATLSLLCCCFLASHALAQQDQATLDQESPAAAATNEAAEGADSVVDAAEEAVQETAAATEKAVEGVFEQIDKNPQAQEVSAGVLQPIYTVAEHLAFPAFHWVAFALMATGVVSFALQLVLGKLVVLSRMGLSFKEIISDALGLVISVIGLVLTTQAAAENSTFTQSPAAVLSASAVGVILGFIFYLWGQSQEIEAARGRSAAARVEKKG